MKLLLNKNKQMSQFELQLVTVNDFHKICRTCSIDEKIFPITGTLIADVKLEDLLTIGVGLSYRTEDLLPQNICQECITNLYRVYNFKQCCQKNIKNLSLLLEDSTVEKSDEGGLTDAEIIRLELEKEMKLAGISNEEIEGPAEVKLEPEEIYVKDEISGENDSSLDDEPEEFANKDNIGKSSQCRTMAAQPATQDDFRENLKTPRKKSRVAKILCAVCAKVVSRSKMKQHMESHNEHKLFLCDKCPKSFISKRYLTRHEVVHKDFLPFLCRFCGKKFRQSQKLSRHEAKHASDKDSDAAVTYTCTICGRVLKHEHLYNYHMSKHLEPDKSKEFKCRFCDRDYNNEASLRAHLVKHGEPKYVCPECGKAFWYNSELKQHSIIHTGEKPHRCNICFKSFPYGQSLKIHMLTHTKKKEFQCGICSQSFAQKQHLKTHLLVHSGEKQHKCGYCGVAFAHKGNLVVHERTHTLERPYVCDVCGTGFPESNSLKRHRAKTHLVVINVEGSIEPKLEDDDLELE